ncbi:MAG: hypothetical protein WC595_02205 [Candidatus Nanoarchaeia archaeon]
MKIYVAHSKEIAYMDELYGPLERSDLAREHEFIFPHKEGKVPFESKVLFESGLCKLVLAEVSRSATGLGIELGWADLLHIPIVCVYRSGSKIGGSLKVVSKDFIEYESSEDLVKKVQSYLKGCSK